MKAHLEEEAGTVRAERERTLQEIAAMKDSARSRIDQAIVKIWASLSFVFMVLFIGLVIGFLTRWQPSFQNGVQAATSQNGAQTGASQTRGE